MGNVKICWARTEILYNTVVSAFCNSQCMTIQQTLYSEVSVYDNGAEASSYIKLTNV